MSLRLQVRYPREGRAAAGESRDDAGCGKCSLGQALYGCLCQEDGAVIQDGTVFRLTEDHFRFHLAEPSLRWLRLNATVWI
jgi:hypothetical protein